MLQSKSKAKVQAINPYQKMAQDRQQHGLRHRYVRQVHKRRIILLLALLVLICGVGGFQIFQAKRALDQTQTKVIDQQKQLKQAKSKRDDLKLQASQLKNDDYLQKVIRSRYYYSKGNETIYSLPTDKANTVTQK